MKSFEYEFTYMEDRGIELICKVEGIQPPEPMTREYPGCSLDFDSFTMHLEIKGKCFDLTKEIQDAFCSEDVTKHIYKELDENWEMIRDDG